MTNNIRLIYLMGPSGVGKDSLLAALRQDPARENFLIAHRYITRPPSAGDCEQHVFLSEREFDRRRQRGLFALDWRAHGHAYAAGVELDFWLAQGFSVILNGSRQYFPTARRKYAGRLMPVCLTVSADTLAKRLLARGRENAGEIEARLVRAQSYQECLPPGCRTLDNEGDIQETARRFLRLIEEDAGMPFRKANAQDTAQGGGNGQPIVSSLRRPQGLPACLAVSETEPPSGLPRRFVPRNAEISLLFPPL